MTIWIWKWKINNWQIVSQVFTFSAKMVCELVFEALSDRYPAIQQVIGNVVAVTKELEQVRSNSLTDRILSH